MKVLLPGSGQKGWSAKVVCTGAGNGGGGCNALLLAEQADLFLTESHVRDETTTYVTFRCPCGVETDLFDQDLRIPFAIRAQLPTKRAWEASR